VRRGRQTERGGGGVGGKGQRGEVIVLRFLFMDEPLKIQT